MKKTRILLTALVLGCILLTSSSFSYVLEPYNWSYLGYNPTVTMKVNPNCADPTAPNELIIVLAAMNTWTTCVANFNFNYGGPTSVTNATYNGQNDICWNPGSSGGALATTTMWYSGTHMTQADIVYWDGPWIWSTAQTPAYNQFDVESVGLHELGHVVGLGHSQYNYAVMWYAINYGEVQRVLDQDDINGILAIYGSANISMSITLNEQGPTNLPSTGGTIPYTVAIHNNTNATITFDGWTEYLNSQGQSQGLIIFRTDVNIGAYATIYRYLSLNIASTVPNDTYNYWGRVALTYPVPVIDDDYFTFTKGIGDDGGPQVLDSEKPVIAEANIPQNFGITSAYPNPFNPETTIEFELPTTSHINLTIYNLQGEIVAVLLEGDIPAGQYGVKWNASNFAAGTYIYLLKSDSWSSSGRLVLVK